MTNLPAAPEGELPNSPNQALLRGDRPAALAFRVASMQGHLPYLAYPQPASPLLINVIFHGKDDEHSSLSTSHFRRMWELAAGITGTSCFG